MNKFYTFFIFLVSVSTCSFGQTKKWTLEECVNYALQNNISIKQSELDNKGSKIDNLEAKAAFLPNLNANSNYSVNTGANINPTTNQFSNETFKSLSSGANASITIFNGLRNWKNMQRAKLNAISNSFRLEKMKDDIALNIANAYLQILFSKEQIKVQQNQKAITEANIKRTNDLIEAGTLPKGDIYELEATLTNQEQQLVNTTNTLFIAKLNLAQILNIKEYANFDIVDMEYDLKPSAVEEEKPETILAKAKEFIKDIKIANANLEVAKKDVALARSSYYPTLTGFMGYNNRWSSNIPLNFMDQLSFFDGTAYGLQLNVPILNGLSARTRVMRSKQNVERNNLALQQSELDLERNVYQAYNDVVNAKKTYQSAQKTLEARQKANEFSRDRYEVGLLNAFDYSQSTTALENALSEVVRTKYDYIFRTKILEFYFGIPIINNK
jgi:outer membrane protein